ncbi:hypothetical protein AOQ84DRAFT_282375 [Glonium stellatum]|uniref:DUF7730 domain-containing protein n=1 Tax=Glonium stellatum TaxID=574774 RepID=A0A8E2JY13_9PEZI|nr:hypothetical protein AOQ84DRAFT_282375 [Glonium stellatum]
MSTSSPTQASDKPFPFMLLPTELRIHIYRMALSRPKPILLHMARAPELDNSSHSADSDCSERASTEVRRRTVQSFRPPQCTGTRSTSENINSEPIVPALLRVSQQVYREARPVLYADNRFVLQLDSAGHTLRTLHQRSRSLIKHVCLTIPTHHDILEGFADLVRLGLRYCWGLRTFTITLPYMFPEDRTISSTTNVYANAFHILRWLPKNCVVKLEGNVHEEIRRVVEDNGRLAVSLDEKAYLRRQHQMPDRP